MHILSVIKSSLRMKTSKKKMNQQRKMIKTNHRTGVYWAPHRKVKDRMVLQLKTENLKHPKHQRKGRIWLLPPTGHQVPLCPWPLLRGWGDLHLHSTKIWRTREMQKRRWEVQFLLKLLPLSKVYNTAVCRKFGSV